MPLTVADGLADRIGRSGDFQVILEDDLSGTRSSSRAWETVPAPYGAMPRT
jgi:hypothetical protein